jgi:hypothetical protein|tara:strand:+ start:98 stop:322 length:225 start_codon:yes stop_codon:yes gene_type:complete
MWRVWAKALGQKDGRDVKEADKIAIIRTFIMVQLIITNFFIIAGNTKNLWFGHKDTKCSVMSINKDTVPPNKVV